MENGSTPEAHFTQKVLLPYREPSRVAPYVDALMAVGLQPELALTERELSLDGSYGLLLMGGTDVDPALYGEERDPQTQTPDRERDDIEMNLVEQAMERDIPILAICRGQQLLNVWHGGTLIQHLESATRHQQISGDRSISVHEIAIEPRSRLFGISGSPAWSVNSRHHQAVKSLGRGLQVSARAVDDGVVEGLERPDKRFVVAVQWHPEDQIRRHPEQLELFRAFRRAIEETNNR